MGIFDGIKGFLKGAGQFVDDLNEKSTIYLEETRIRSRAEEVIKTDNFSSDMERTIMLAAAERESRRTGELAAKLASDPVLSKFFSEALDRMKASVPLDTVRDVRIAEEAAMSSAVSKRSLERELEKDPRLRKAFDAAYERTRAAFTVKGEADAGAHSDSNAGNASRVSRERDAATELDGRGGAAGRTRASSSMRSGFQGKEETLASMFKNIRDNCSGGQVVGGDPPPRGVDLGRLDASAKLPPSGKVTDVRVVFAKKN